MTEDGTDRRTRVTVADVAYLDDRASGLVSAHQAGVPDAMAQIREWHPHYRAMSAEDLARAPFDQDNARLVYAREHGFDDWAAFVVHVESIAAGRTREPFKEAFDALRARDFDRLDAILTEHPEVAQQRGTNGNTLLNLGVSLGGSGHQPLSTRANQTFDRLVSLGADVNQANDRGWTPLHQAAYSNQPHLVSRLLAAGADTHRSAHGDGGTPLAVALFWGHREAADVLVPAGVHPANLRIAAGLGRSDLVAACFERDGTLTAMAAAGRGFYRPHSGFPIWRPSHDRQEILDEALVWAAKADRVDVLPGIVARGARIDADPYRGTPLLWAAFAGRIGAIRWLLDHGAPINQRATFGGPQHGQGVTALHMAAERDQVDVVRLLLECGADAAITDDLYGGTPSGWAEHNGASRTLALFKSAKAERSS